MTRPNPGLLALFLLAVLLILAGPSLMKGGFYIGKHEGDTLHLLQIVFREARGQWPHLDFQTPIGLLATAPIALFVWLGLGAGHAILYAQILVAAIALPAIWWVAASRFPGGIAYVFGALVLVLILALVHGEAEPAVSISMHYNRWAWAAAFVAIAAAMLPTEEEFRAPALDGLVIGGALAVMALTKITYFAAFLIPIAVALAGRRAWRTVWVALATGFAVFAALTLLAGTPLYWVAYARDLFTVMASDVRPQPGLPFTQMVAAPAQVGAHLLLFVGVILLRQSGRTLEGLVLLLLAPGFVYVTFQNYGNDPQWLWLFGLMLIALRPVREHHLAIGWEARHALTLAGVIALTFATPSIVNLAPSPFRHLATKTEDFIALLPGSGVHEDLQASRRRSIRVDGKVAMDLDGMPFAAYSDPELRKDEIATFQGETWPACSLDLGTVAFFEAISDDLRASGLTGGKTIFAADILSSFWLFNASAPLPGASPWYYGGLPGWDNADFLLVPRCPLVAKVRKLILDEITAAGTPLTEVRRNEMYVLYAK